MKIKNRYFSMILPVTICLLIYFALLRAEVLAAAFGKINLVLRPFVFGCVLAYLLAPLCEWAKKLLTKQFLRSGKMSEAQCEKKANSLSVLLIIILMFLMIYIFLAMVIPQLINSLTMLTISLPVYMQNISDWMEGVFSRNPELYEQVSELIENSSLNTTDFIKQTLLPYLETLLGGFSQTFGVLKDMMIGLFAAIYLLLERKTFRRQGILLITALLGGKNTSAQKAADTEPDEGMIVDPDSPDSIQAALGIIPDGETRADKFLHQLSILNAYLTGFIKGKLIDSLIIGILCGIFTVIAGMPYAPLVSVIVGVTNIIPFFGPFFGGIPSALLIFMVSPTKCLIFTVFVIILQQFDGNVLGPKILGDATNLSSFWILFSIILFGGLMGVPGMIIGVPVFGFIYHLVREWTYKKLGRKSSEE